MPQINYPDMLEIPREVRSNPEKWGTTYDALEELDFVNDVSLNPNSGAMLTEEQMELYESAVQAVNRFYKKNQEDRNRYFKEDGSCTGICPWGYAIDRETHICIALEDCKKEFRNE